MNRSTKPKTEICRHVAGYWINREAGQFRCYACGFQHNLRDLVKMKRKIEHWEEVK